MNTSLCLVFHNLFFPIFLIIFSKIFLVLESNEAMPLACSSNTDRYNTSFPVISQSYSDF